MNRMNRFVGNWEDLEFDDGIEKANPYHDELGRFTSADKATGGKRKRPNIKRKEARVATKPTLDHEYLTHSGYGSLPEPTDDLKVAATTGAPIRWLMPNSMAEPLAELYDSYVSERSNTVNKNPPNPNTFVLQLGDELVELGFSEEEAIIVANGLRMRANFHAKERTNLRVLSASNSIDGKDQPVIDQALGGVDEIPRWNEQTRRSVFGEMGDEFVGIHVNGIETVQEIIGDKRYKTQFETGVSGGYLNPEKRAQQEVAMFSLHPSLNPQKRPVYGQIYTEGFSLERWHSAQQYGQIVLVLKPSTHSRTSWTSGDSLGNTAQASSFKKPTFHGGEPKTPDADLWGGISLVYTEAQIHGGVKTSDISHIIIPTDRGLGPEGFRKEFGIPSSIKIVNMASLEEGNTLSKTATSTISLEAILVATSGKTKLYVFPNDTEKGYVEFDNGSVFKVNPQDVYSRGYWKLIKSE